jgi:serine/threonine-protein kinase
VEEVTKRAASSTEGRPYFVMELVRGVPITEYCDERRLATRQRLELFVSVCQAVQHAHQKGIIHRDLKPTNVLVTQHDTLAVPKVIDFGIAKATGSAVGGLTERTLFTNFAQMLGTPLYMSPEQAEMNGLDVDTRSDVYSLGVVLYELLTGTTPFEIETPKKVGLDEMRRMIREEEPPPTEPAAEHSERRGLLDGFGAARSGRSPTRTSAARRNRLDRDESGGERPRPAL